MQSMKIGPWKVVPSQNVIERGGAQTRLEPRAMDLLVYLAGAGDRVVSADEILREVWHGRVFDDGIVYKKINQLRKALGDDLKHPAFIETIPKRGYRLVAPVTASAASPSPPITLEPAPLAGASASGGSGATRAVAAAGRPRRLMSTSAAAAAVFAVSVGLALRDVRAPRHPAVAFDVTPLEYEQDGRESLILSASMVFSADGTAIAFATQDNDGSAPPRPFALRFDAPSALPLLPPELVEGGLPRAWTRAGHIVMNVPRTSGSLGESAGLVTVPAVGGAPEKIFDMPSGTTNVVALTPDGSTVAALRRDDHGVWGIWVGSVASGELRRYAPAPFEARGLVNGPSLVFSPDGRQLMLWWNPTDDSGVPRGEQAWLLPYPSDPAHPPRIVLERFPAIGTMTFSWLPDNRHVVATGAQRGKGPTRIYIADTQSGRFRALTDATSSAPQQAPVVSPDGRRFVFTEYFHNLDIVTLNVRTGDVSPVLATNRVEQMPAWSSDGKKFVYVAVRDNEFEIWSREPGVPDGPSVTPRDFPTGTTAALYAPQLSPDGKRLLYGRIEANERGAATDSRLWMSSTAGGSPMQFPGGTGPRQIPGSWSPDGEWYAYFAIHPDDSLSLVKARTSGRFETETLATGLRETYTIPAWSHDGAWILFDDGNGLKLVSADGTVTRDLGMKQSACAFALGEPLLHCVRDFSGSASLVVSDFDGHTRFVAPIAAQHRPANSMGPSLRLSPTPDGNGLTYSVDVSRTRLLLVDGLADVALP